MGQQEDVVLCAPDGYAVGRQRKSEVHHRNTPLHLAFSCYLFDLAGRLLVTRRARSKRTWPGVRTNTCCGHPAPGEPLPEAIHRRLDEELGVRADRMDLVLPRFSYRAVMDDGTVENELCPVYRATVSDVGPLGLDSSEVDSAWWEPWSSFVADVLAKPDTVSPWCARQVAEFDRLGAEPPTWPVADNRDLPAAAIA